MTKTPGHIHLPSSDEIIDIQGAREHNLKDIDLVIPRNSLVVFTGLSGSGKSSLAFDTLFAEGQRRYLETFSAYARQFVGDMKRPDVDKVKGLSPVIAIEQKTVSRNPRSTVGTVTEVYDFLRLLFARAGEAYSYVTGEKMVKFSEEQITTHILEAFEGQKITVTAPVIKSRKGHYRELFEQIKKRGYNKVWVDGSVQDIVEGMMLNRYVIHDIDIVIDRIDVKKASPKRLEETLKTALKVGDGFVKVITEGDEVRSFSKNLMDPVSGISYQEPQPNSFSFNSPYGACEHCEGLGIKSQVNLEYIIPDKTKSINKGAIIPLGELRENWTFQQLRELAKKYKFSLADPIEKLTEAQLHVVLYGDEAPIDIKLKGDKWGGHLYETHFKGVINMVADSYFESDDDKMIAWAEEFVHQIDCEVCQGNRLKQESLHFKIADKNISELSKMNINDLESFLGDIEGKLTDRQHIIATELLKEIKSRISFLSGVGLGYLSLHSPAKTLSGGEAQRIRLATQIGSKLVNVLYILDEPSIGLHQRDNERLISSLKELRDLGNSVLVVEHDEDMMRASDWLVEIGPFAGKRGGEIVASGTVEQFLASEATTAKYLTGKAKIAIPESVRPTGADWIELKGCTGNNLKGVDLRLPLGLFVCVTGVSGSGKSSLINETLYPLAKQKLYGSYHRPLPYETASGFELIDKVIRIDQSPIGKTPRSNPATYVGVFQEIRNLFAQIPESLIRGYKPGRFSFNVRGGRCDECRGGGKKVIEMNFLPNVEVHCDACQGKRYNRETLEVRYKGKSIYDVLEMPVSQAVSFFEHTPQIYRKLKTMEDVGLGYITLGQSSTTLSGGEAQRVKLSTELSKRDTGKTLFILDEPTTGLHFDDIQQLLSVLQTLVDKGNTVLVIEHNLDVIRCADWIIDVGPEGGKAGGQIIATGVPKDIKKVKASHTGRFI
jgi:excinuclease ABC subunit A